MVRTADRAGVMLALPVGDPDILWMGMAWHCRDHDTYLRALVAAIHQTHAVDPRRIFVYGSGEGGHATVATATRSGDWLAAAAAFGPPFFDGASRRGNHVLPITVPEMLAAKSSRTSALLIMAGTQDKGTSFGYHSVGGVAADRYEDSGSIAASQVESCAGLLRTGLL